MVCNINEKVNNIEENYKKLVPYIDKKHIGKTVKNSHRQINIITINVNIVKLILVK